MEPVASMLRSIIPVSPLPTPADVRSRTIEIGARQIRIREELNLTPTHPITPFSAEETLI